MSLFVFFSFLLFGKIAFSSSSKTTQVTLPVEDRVAILKSKIIAQIKNKHGVYEKPSEYVTAVNENVEYENLDNEPITPISETDPRKKKGRFKLKPIKTTRGLQNSTVKYVSKIPQRNKEHVNRPSKNKMAKKMKITDVFYRRFFDSFSYQWMHCQSLITPFLTGHKTNMTLTKRITYDDHTVVRLVQLLTEDTTDHTKEDIHSILYHISNLQIRLFQWDVAAIKLLLGVINRDKSTRHTSSLRKLKIGLKAIFANWNLNFKSNIGVLMKQTRLFRPPCVKLMESEGSTKTSKSVRYTKSVKPKKDCSKADEDDETCN